MKGPLVWIVVAVVVVGAGAGGYWLGHRGAGASAGKDADEATGAKTQEKPVATVTVTPLRRGTISDEAVAYGTVIAPSSEVRVVSVPFEARVRRVLVAPGQTVKADEPLIEVEGSAATQLALEEARNTQSAAERDLQLVQQRYEQKLATNTDLYAAQNALRTAQGRLKSLEQSGAGGPRQLKADAPGIVSKVDVQIGQVTPAGSPLIEVAAQNRIEVRLGAEPEDAPYLKAGQSVDLVPVEQTAGEPIAGKIRLVGQRVDPMTRLVDVFVSLPPNAKLLLETFVIGRTTKASAEGLIVPRAAVVPGEDGGAEVFTVRDHHAVKHVVKVGMENDTDAQVTAEDLKEGEPVVVTGSHEVEDGMEVKTEPAASQPTTEPAAEKSADKEGGR